VSATHSTPALLQYRAGPSALEQLRAGALTTETLAAIAGPASGPKWLILSGIDRALLASPLLSTPTSRRMLLVGSSAGAWRMLALASRDPETSHRHLLDGYVNQTFAADFTAAGISQSHRRILAGMLVDQDIRHLLAHPRFDVAAHVVRVRYPFGWTSRFTRQVQMVNLGLVAMLQALSSGGTERLLERVLFHTRPEGLNGTRFTGPIVRFTRENLLDASLASGTVPIYMTPVRDPHGAPPGLYMDGGLADYHLRENYAEAAPQPGITLFTHFQRRIVPNWFDRYWARRLPSSDVLDSVLQVYPSDNFIARLPDGRIPHRDDLFTYSDNPQERIRRWHEAAQLSDELGQAFLDDLEHGRIPDLVKPF
jgi:hypothetical protein